MAQVSTTSAPAALGPYSQAIRVNGFLFASGQLGIDPATGELAEGIAAQTAQALTNLKNVLEAGRSSMDDVVKTTCFMADLSEFDAFNEEYARFFPMHPARECVQVAALPKGARIEISAIAITERDELL